MEREKIMAADIRPEKGGLKSALKDFFVQSKVDRNLKLAERIMTYVPSEVAEYISMDSMLSSAFLLHLAIYLIQKSGQEWSI